MKRVLPLAALAVALVASAASDSIIVLDATDNAPVIGATAFSRSGTIIGITEADGRIDRIKPTSYPITVKCLGYAPADCENGRETLRLIPATYPLGEVTVTPYDRPIARIICYIREFTSGETTTDTIQCFSEHMADFYIPTVKVKKFKGNKSPRIIKSKVYERYANNQGTDSVKIPDHTHDDISWCELISFPSEKREEPEELRSGATIHTSSGKSGAAAIHRKTGGIYTESIDYLADRKEHVYSPNFFKLMGFTIDITEMRGAWAYPQNDTGIHQPWDLLYGTFSLDITGRGKWIKKAFNASEPVRMHAFYEIYPVSVEYVTVKEAKEQLNKKVPATKFRRSELAGPLSPSIESIVARASAK